MFIRESARKMVYGNYQNKADNNARDKPMNAKWFADNHPNKCSHKPTDH